MGYFLNLAIAVDQLANALLSGSADETLSARAHRQRVKGSRVWGWTAGAIDAVFLLLFSEHDHCRQSWESELQRRQLHPSYGLPDTTHHPV